jgi:hypothetical protein
MTGHAVSSLDNGEINTVTVYNETGYTLEEIYLSPRESDYWGPNLLVDGETIESGAFRGFFVHFPGIEGGFDLLCVDTEGYGYLISGVSLLRDRRNDVVVSFEKLMQDGLDLQRVTLTIGNSSVPIFRLFIAPSDSPALGGDLLDGSRLLTTGEALAVTMPFRRGRVSYTVTAVDEDLDIYVRELIIDSKEPLDNLSAVMSRKDMTAESLTNHELNSREGVNREEPHLRGQM